MADETPPLRPPLPIAKRLNRNALIVVALVLGLTAVVVVVTMRPAAREAGTTAAPDRPGLPSFLDRPMAADTSRAPERIPDSSVAPEDGSDRPLPPPGQAPDASRGPADDPYAAARFAALNLPPTPPPLSPRDAAYERALRSAPVGEPGGATAGRGQDATALGPAPDAMGDVPGEGLTPTAPALATPTAAATPDRTDYGAFLSAHTTAPAPSTAPFTTPASPYVLTAGTVLSGLLLTGVVSDLPGEIIGQVSRDVYDSPTQQLLLIPKGSKLIGTYDTGVTLGQNRLLVAWTQLIFPDGRTLALPGLGISDQHGAAGVQDAVDNHYRRLFGHAALLSAIGAGVQLSQPQASGLYAAPSAGQTAAAALGQTLGDVSTEVIRRNLDVRPTITIRAGMPFTVVLRGEIVLPGAYVETRR